jgi:hypothetical protein
MIKQLNSGSVTLVILLAFTGFVLIHSMQTLELFLVRDICTKRRLYEQQFRLTEVLLNYGVVLCKEHYSDVIKQCEKQKELTGIADPWPLHGELENAYKGVITLRTLNDQIAIQARLMREGKICAVLSCRLERKINKKSTTYIINSWHNY